MAPRKYELAAAIEELIPRASGNVKEALQQALELALQGGTGIGLTDRQVERLRKGFLLDEQCSGLRVQHMPRGGGKMFRLRIRDKHAKRPIDRDKLVDLGLFDPEDFTVTDARKAAAEFKATGRLPAKKTRLSRAREVQDGQITLSALIERFNEHYCEGFDGDGDRIMTDATAKQRYHQLLKFLDIIKDQPAATLDPMDVRDALIEFQQQTGPAATRQVTNALRIMRRVGMGADSKLQLPSSELWLPASTTDWLGSYAPPSVKKSGRTTKASDVANAMNGPELRSFVRKLDQCGLPLEVQGVLKLQLLTGARIGEIIEVKRSSVFLEDNMIHDAKTKNGTAFDIRLSSMAKELVEKLMTGQPKGGKGWLFPSPRDPRRPITDDWVSKSLAAKRKCLGVERVGKDLESRRAVTPHTMRHTLSSWLKENGYGKDIRDAITNHAGQGVDAVYSGGGSPKALVEKALETWADHVHQLYWTG